MNRLPTGKETESAAQPLLTEEAQDQTDGSRVPPDSTGPSQNAPKTERGALPNAFWEASMTMIRRPDKNTTRKLHTNTCKYRRKIHNTRKPNPTAG